MGMRDVEWVTHNGKAIPLSKCATCVSDPKTCGTTEMEFIKEKELPNCDQLSHKIVWCRHYDKAK